MKKILSQNFLLIFLFISLISSAQISTIFNDIKFNESILEIEERLNKISNNVKLVKVTAPNFPLSKNKEEHLVASRVKVQNEIIDKVVFTFSDDRLCFIQAKGNIVNGLTKNINGELKNYLGYQVYFSDLLFIQTEEDVAWILSPESFHLNLFTWHNPYLKDINSQIKYNESVKIPDFIQMEGNISFLHAELIKSNISTNIEKLEESDSITKTQINCFGIEYAGFPRKFELRFENNKLNMVWILTGKGEENRLRKKLTQEYGSVLFINDSWEVFNNWTVMLRKDKSEILLLSKELAEKYKNQYLK